MDEPNERALEQGLLEGTPYRVIGRLGAEPGGERLEVEHVKLRKRFTLLALRAPEPRFDRVERLLRELRELARLAHPNIDLPADAGTTKDGVTYLVTSPERGETLAARLARGPLGTIAALGVAADVASALGAAHAAGVAHRGVLPSRILLGPRGARLTGFGLARLTASSNELAGSGARGDLVAVGRLLVEHAAADPELAALTAALVGPAPAGRALDGRSVALTLRRLAARLRGGVLDDAPTRAIRYDALTAAEQTLVDPPESAPPAADDDRTHPDGVARDERTIIDGPRAGTGVAARSAERASEVAAPAEVPSARSAPATSRPRAERVRRRYAAPFLTFCAGFGAALGLSTTLALARWLAPSAATPTVAALDAAP
ncbi:MAG: hypothetical protein OZ928_19460, partial [Polyangiaceae bacterium]|nr:hypothetical protein [Polyangiaceae bacterium]